MKKLFKTLYRQFLVNTLILFGFGALAKDVYKTLKK